MELTGQINNFNLSPIKDYNQVLNNQKAFELDDNDINFEDILAKQSELIKSPQKVEGSVSLNKFDDVVAQNSIFAESPQSTGSAGNFINSIGNSINGGLNSVNNSIEVANEAQEAFATGKDVSVHDVMIASEKATLSLSMAMQLRNKLLNAYNEINNVKV